MDISKREEQVLLAVAALEEEAYLVRIRKHLSTILGKKISIGAVHIPLRRLERAGLVDASFGEATAVRGGRRKKIYVLTPKAKASLRESKRIHDVLWARFGRPETRRILP
ncbi:MAG: helix-turn-helix transcriptional regulator [Candidatus Aminicenantes bacterium]|nr:helix-turn-helix transcriptional regulator [Candidatus Aminicenantes bacterium]